MWLENAELEVDAYSVPISTLPIVDETENQKWPSFKEALHFSIAE